jgi:hypothetical protein
MVDNYITGVEVWKSSTGSSGTWTQSNVDGFGNPQNTGAWAAAVFDDYLYVATAGSEDWQPPEVFGVEVWRTDGDNNWVKVTLDGFGGTENVAWDLAHIGGKLYLSTGNFSYGAQVWRCVICDGSDWEHVVDGAFGSTLVEYQNQLIAITTNNWSSGENGIDVWSSKDGVQWTRISSHGFGDVNNNKTGTSTQSV